MPESHPRPEYPRPQFYRDTWLNLNGAWNFAFDFGLSGEEKGWPEDPAALDLKIVVPFCPESSLSGIGHTDFIPAAWYHRAFSVPDTWAGSRVRLHFGAVDYDCRAWVNGRPVGRHYGGSSSFAFHITEDLQATPTRFPELSISYTGQPYVVDEYGGTWWSADTGGGEQDPDRKGSWGYGRRPGAIEEVYDRIEKLTAVLTDHPHIAGFTYTQLTDVEQEQNGIYTYDRKPKFDVERLRKAFGAPAAIEQSTGPKT